jgi:hypothetical protein
MLAQPTTSISSRGRPNEEASEESFPASDAPAWAMGEEGKRIPVSNNSTQPPFGSIDRRKDCVVIATDMRYRSEH